MRFVTALMFAIMALCLGLGTAHAERRVALVVGNNNYTNLPENGQLSTAVNDARAVGDALGRLGFEVIEGENLSRSAFSAKFDELTRKLSPGDTALFYFAGHGVTLGGGNYLLPSDAPDVESGQESLLARTSLGEEDIVADIQARGVRVAVVVLDACRINPFKRSGRRSVGGERGLSRIEAASGVFKLYSAGIGQAALDRLGKNDRNPNSVFTRVLVPELMKPGLDLTALAKLVGRKVQRLASTVDHEQQPAYYDQILDNVYLAGALSNDQTSPLKLNDVTTPLGEAELVWSKTKNTTDQAVLEEFIHRFDDSYHASLARARLQELQKNPQAVEWYRKAADQGGAIAQSNLGFMYEKGLGVAQDDTQAVAWYRKAAEQGDAYAQYSLGLRYANGRSVAQDVEQAVAWYRKAADQGIADAQYNLGVMYEKGLGVARDEAQAVVWYRKAADQGVADAQNNLGARYAKGLGVARDEAQAVVWYRKAADQGIADAQYNLGVRYAKGLGVVQDDAQAVAWYRKAADQGLADAQYNLGVRYAKGLGVVRDDVQAVAWYRKAASQGFADAQYNLGMRYANGVGVVRDDAQAIALYRKAADRGVAQAQKSLGVRYANGLGVGRDDAEAVEWFRKAADQGDAAAQNNLGLMYRDGRGVVRDDAQAVMWLRKAADQGFADAQEALRRMEARGRVNSKLVR